MKGTPFKTRRLYSPFMQADPSLSGGQIPIDPTEKNNKFNFSKKADYSNSTATSKAITEFITPQNNLELGLEFAGGGLGVGFGKGVSRLAKTKLGKKLISKLPWLRSLTKPITTSSKNNMEFDFNKKNNYSADQMNVKGADKVTDSKFNYEGATNYTSGGKITDATEFRKVTNDALDGLRSAGRSTDEALAKMNYNISTDLKPEHITKLGTQNGRGIFEVTFPDGTTQKFWRSTGTGGKAVTLADGSKVASEGFFGALPGHMDVDVPGMKVDGWFIKGQDWQGYGSKTYTETGAKLKEMFDKGIIK